MALLELCCSSLLTSTFPRTTTDVGGPRRRSTCWSSILMWSGRRVWLAPSKDLQVGGGPLLGLRLRGDVQAGKATGIAKKRLVWVELTQVLVRTPYSLTTTRDPRLSGSFTALSGPTYGGTAPPLSLLRLSCSSPPYFLPSTTHMQVPLLSALLSPSMFELLGREPSIPEHDVAFN